MGRGLGGHGPPKNRPQHTPGGPRRAALVQIPHRLLGPALAARAALGEGVPRDAPRGFQLLLAAAEGGDARAVAAVARCYWEGLGVAEDAARALEWVGRVSRVVVARGSGCTPAFQGFRQRASAAMPLPAACLLTARLGCRAQPLRRCDLHHGDTQGGAA